MSHFNNTFINLYVIALLSMTWSMLTGDAGAKPNPVFGQSCPEMFSVKLSPLPATSPSCSGHWYNINTRSLSHPAEPPTCHHHQGVCHDCPGLPEEQGGLEWREDRTRSPGQCSSARYEPEGTTVSALDTTSCPVAPGLSPPPWRHQHLGPAHVGLARDEEEGGGGAGGGQGLQDYEALRQCTARQSCRFIS